ncbi:MAG: hypothetical protein QM500_02695 [Methylococcales bacterium]
MHLLLSGEGRGDIGICSNDQGQCVYPEYQPGAMAYFVDKLVELFLGYDYSHIEYEGVTFVSEKYLVDNKLPPRKKAMDLPGKKKATETQYYYQNARVLANKAKSLAIELNEKVVAVLFRDVDGTASAGRGHWKDKVNAMEKGFADEDYAELGVPMMPKPKSEVWLLCAVKNNPYQHCDSLENESGNDNAPNPLKSQLQNALDDNSSVQIQIDMIKEGAIDVTQIDMPSFNYFRNKLARAVDYAK